VIELADRLGLLSHRLLKRECWRAYFIATSRRISGPCARAGHRILRLAGASPLLPTELPKSRQLDPVEGYDLPVRPDAPITRGEFLGFRAEVEEFRGETDGQFHSLRKDLNSFQDEFRAFQLRLFAHLDQNFRRIDQRFDAVDARFAGIDGRFDDVYSRFATLEAESAAIKIGLKRLEDEVRRK
jgi:hypothetical protein